MTKYDNFFPSDASEFEIHGYPFNVVNAVIGICCKGVIPDLKIEESIQLSKFADEFGCDDVKVIDTVLYIHIL